MSTLLSVQSLSYTLTSSPLMDAISFTLNQGDRIGLVGHNGCGKSTLLKLLTGDLTPQSGTIIQANQCIMARIEQHLPDTLIAMTMLDAVIDMLPEAMGITDGWRAEILLAEMGFTAQQQHLTAGTLSGGQHTRLLLARALIQQPDLLLLDEPSNHLDLPTLLWLEQFLQQWRGSFILVSHDQRLLDNVTNSTWIMRDQGLQLFRLPCSQARVALLEQDAADQHRHNAEQKEIDRVEKSAKRLAIWGKTYDNEDLARKSKTMMKRADKLKDQQTELSSGTPWQLKLKGEALQADKLLGMSHLSVRPALNAPCLFSIIQQQVKSGDRVAIMGKNGSGKSSLLRLLWQQFQQQNETGVMSEQASEKVVFNPRCRLGYYDQSLQQLPEHATLLDALREFTPLADEPRKMALISAGFAYARHGQTVSQLSGGERSRLLFVGLTLANYHLLFLDEPTNHLDLTGKEELAQTLVQFAGGILLVSHDRDLIESSCNRFWLVDETGLTEWHDLDKLYAVMAGKQPNAQEDKSSSATKPHSQPITLGLTDEEKLVERLVDLETKLDDDLARKAKHQKPKQQQVWQAEIALLNTQLGIE